MKPSSEIQKILSGEKIPQFSAVDYTTKQGRQSLKKVLEEQKEILKRKELTGQKNNRRAHDFTQDRR
ncbi:MAG: hypothetical protein WC875_02260 [Candidatus Absconditabacterales bacterium]